MRRITPCDGASHVRLGRRARMLGRFASNLALALVGAALAALSLTLGADTAGTLALAAGIAAALLALAALPTLERTATQRRLDVLCALLGAAGVVVTRLLDGGALRWSSFALGCALAALGVLGLALYERDNQALLDRLIPGRQSEPEAPPTGGPPILNANQEPEGVHRMRGPLAMSYWSAALLVVLALVPYLVLATTVGAVGPQVARDVGLSEQGLALADGMSNAAYAAGTVLALQLTVHLPGRRLLVVYAALFVIGSVLAAWAPTPGLFVAGRIAQGGMTGLMLIAAVPPLVVGWPVRRLKSTAIVMNMGIFGAVAAGPVIGGIIGAAGGEAWRTLFWIVAGLGAGALVLAVLTFYDQPAIAPWAPWAPSAFLLAAAGCGLTFFGSAQLTSHAFVSTWVLLPLASGIALIVLLVLTQYHARRPLMPLKALTSTFPVAGIVVAISAGAASVGVIELVEGALRARGESPGHVGVLFLPQFGGALLAAAIFGLLFTTKWTKVIALAGLLLVAAGAALMTGVSTGSEGLVWVGTAALGFGVGASVAPALFVAGFSLPSNNIARIFAVIELLRAVAAFSVAPVLAHIAQTVGGSPAAGTSTAIWICFGIALGGALVAVYLFVLARAKPHHPHIDRWIGGSEPAFDSPALAAALRGLETDPTDGSEYPGHVEHAAHAANGNGNGNGNGSRAGSVAAEVR